MASQSLIRWRQSAVLRLERVEAARLAVGGRGAIGILAAEQIKHAYVVLLSSHFQGFCRDLHTEAVDCLYPAVSPTSVQGIIKMPMTRTENWIVGIQIQEISEAISIGSTLTWQEVVAPERPKRRPAKQLETLNQTEDAISHQDFDPSNLGGSTS